MKLRILSMVCAALFAFVVPVSAQAGFLEVTTTDDSVDPDDGELSLREAIADAEKGDTVVFDRQLAPASIVLGLGALEVRKELTIAGLGTKNLRVDGNGGTAVFSIEPAMEGVELSNMTISGAGGYGIIAGRPRKIALINCIVEYNTRSGIHLLGAGSLNMINTRVRYNVASGLSVGFPNGNYTLTNSSIKYNGGAGAILNGESGSLTLIYSGIEHNAGPGIISSRNGTLTLINSTVRNNSGFGIGAWNVSKVTLDNSVVQGNTADSGAGLNLAFGSVLNMRNSRIKNNRATSTGGGIEIKSGSTVNISGSVIARNHAGIQGGGIFLSNRGNTLNISDDTSIRRNSPDNCAPADLCP